MNKKPCSWFSGLMVATGRIFLSHSLFARLIPYREKGVDCALKLTLRSSGARALTYFHSIDMPLLRGGDGGARCSAYGLDGGTEWTHSVSIGLVNAGVGSRDLEGISIAVIIHSFDLLQVYVDRSARLKRPKGWCALRTLQSSSTQRIRIGSRHRVDA